MHRVKNVVSFDTPSAEILASADEVGLSVTTLENVIAKGEENMASFQVKEPEPLDVFMLSYTSGTTGDPKGVKLSHQMVMQCAESVN